ncbi:HNH endonuclease [Acinetobacter wuhouensis]|uniref:HNH endonuclease n=1 Tax=Acinetobacter wuhouensis TaxID=1879050 RepID=UPI000E32F1A4|nr:HNH endonuclease [Acinetobacter wuhouensis]AXQ24068.1 HNH endonuclease [Acinetobacter wuhouensis]AXQ24099.1 HNH endonuclease [Acinetobacter wuhouensis]
MKLTKIQRAELKQKFGGHCAYCGELLGDKWHADHLIAVVRDIETGKPSKPENDVIENLVPACTACNHNKRSMSLEAWRDLLAHYRDVQVIRDCSQVRHLVRFGLVKFIQEPIVFYFEKMGIPQAILEAERHG